MAQLNSELKREIKRRAVEAGFKLRGSWYYRKSKYEYFQDLIGFGFNGHSGYKAVSSFIGVQHELVEQYFQTLTNTKQTNPYSLLSVNTGYLSSSLFKEWPYDDFSEIDGVCDEMFEEIMGYGTHFYEQYSHLDRLIKVYETREYEVFNGKKMYINKDVQLYTLPLLYLVNGEKQKGEEFIEVIQKSGEYFIGDFQKEYFANYFQFKPL